MRHEPAFGVEDRQLADESGAKELFDRLGEDAHGLDDNEPLPLAVDDQVGQGLELVSALTALEGRPGPDGVIERNLAAPFERARLRKFLERVQGAWYGYGFRSYDYAGHTIVGHRGGIKGYRSLILFDPKKKSGVVAL